MSTRRVVAGGFLTMILAAGGFGLYQRSPSDDGAESMAVVTMSNTAFAPGAVRIRAGGTVTWRNSSQLAHTVTTDPGRVQNRGSVSVPSGASAFHSGNVAPGASWSRRFTVAGTYRYVCVPHEGAGMRGTVVVTE